MSAKELPEKTITRWKDGIDIQIPSRQTQTQRALVAAFEKAIEQYDEPFAYCLQEGNRPDSPKFLSFGIPPDVYEYELVATPLYTTPTILALLFEAYDYGQFSADFDQSLAKPIRKAICDLLDSTSRPNKNKYYVHYNGAAVFVKEAEFFLQQKKESPEWDTSAWYGPIEADDIEQARSKGQDMIRWMKTCLG